MGAPNTFYITTPIYYVNDVPHIGHAYTTVAADVLARYWRLRGRDVFFLTGLDEHGQKVQQAAAKTGIDPQAHCDKLAPQFQTLWKRLNISNDAFIRTTDHPHKSIVQRYLQDLYDKQLIYQDDYTGWYCTFDERFWTEKDVADGLCPDCKRPVEQLREQVNDAGVKRFGSGWTWLVWDGTGLAVISTPNQDNPVTDGKTPLLGIDVWEHAYYLNYQNRRPDYLAAWWNVVNWPEVARRFDEAR